MAYDSVYSQLATEARPLAGTCDNLASAGPLDARTRRLVKLRHAVALALIMAAPGAIRVLKRTEGDHILQHDSPQVRVRDSPEGEVR